jgi:uncharacterized protein (TIGR00255 family)
MPLISMTGYGQAAGAQGLAVDVRTVNHRHLDIACRLPRPWATLEPEVKAAVGRHVRRGRVEVSVRAAGGAEGGGYAVDVAQATRYVEAAHDLRRVTGPSGSLDLAGIMGLPGVVVPEEAALDAAAVRDRLLAALEEALGAAAAMRRDEGTALERAIRGHVEAIRAAVGRLEARRPDAVAEAAGRLRGRIEALCAETPVDPARLAQEVAVLAERSDITEELARLGSHLDQFARALDAPEAVGRTLDFLLVEMNREANTAGAKCQDAAMAADVVALKGEIEKVREQVQNVE